MKGCVIVIKPEYPLSKLNVVRIVFGFEGAEGIAGEALVVCEDIA